MTWNRKLAGSLVLCAGVFGLVGFLTPHLSPLRSSYVVRTPATATLSTTQYELETGEVKAADVSVLSFRQDGSVARRDVRRLSRDGSVRVGRIVTDVERGKKYAFFDAAGLYSEKPLSRKDFTAATYMTPSCDGFLTGEKLVGAVEKFGLTLELFERVEKPAESNCPDCARRLVSTRAPSLGCEVLEREITSLDGRLQSHTVLLAVNAGVDESMFSIDASVQKMERLAQGSPPPR